jgi:hypothetical protein
LIRAYFRDIEDVPEDSLSVDSPRQATKKLLLHLDTDTMTLTLGRLLYWWLESKGLMDDVIYGIPSTDFEISNTYYPQVKLHFREDRYQASNNNRRPARGEVSFRWRETDFSTANVNALANKIYNDFVTPVFYFQRGREMWSYADKSKGYYFRLTVDGELEAKKVIEQVMGVQDTEPPDWEQYLRKHEDKKNYTTRETIRVMGETIYTPKKRPLARVEFAYAELFIPGTTKPIVLVDRTGKKHNALRLA